MTGNAMELPRLAKARDLVMVFHLTWFEHKPMARVTSFTVVKRPLLPSQGPDGVALVSVGHL